MKIKELNLIELVGVSGGCSEAVCSCKVNGAGGIKTHKRDVHLDSCAGDATDKTSLLVACTDLCCGKIAKEFELAIYELEGFEKVGSFFKGTCIGQG